MAAQGGLAFGGGMMINYADVTMDRIRVIDNLARRAVLRPAGVWD